MEQKKIGWVSEKLRICLIPENYENKKMILL